MGLFPTSPSEGQEVTNANGTTFKYVGADDKWIIVGVAGYSAAEVDALFTTHEASPTDINHLTDIQLGALHPAIGAGDLNHNDLANLNAGDVYEHISAAQLAALHPQLTNLTELATRNHNDLLNINAGDSYEHLTLTEKNLIGDAYYIETKEIDTTGIADTKILKYNGTKWVIADDSTGGAGGDTDAYHDNVANEITATAAKTTVADADEFVMEDSAAAYVKKAITGANLKTALGDNLGNHTATTTLNMNGQSIYGCGGLRAPMYSGLILYSDAGDFSVSLDGGGASFHPGSTMNLGQNSATTWNIVYYHTMTDKTCASFVGYSDTELYSMLKAIQPRTDGILHHDDNTLEYFPHIDMATVPKEFACITEEPYDLENMPVKVGETYENTGNIHFDTGSKSGINMNTMVYAMNELMVLQYEKILALESRIIELEKI